MSIGALSRAILAQTGAEVRMTLRRGESVLVTIIIPVALLVFFASAAFLPPANRSMNYLLPGTLALAVISTGLVSLGIATAYERYYGVLKRLGITPFPRAGLVIAKLLTVVAIEVMQVLLLSLIAVLVFGWHPHGSLALSVGILLLGTIAFSGLGLFMAGALRAEATLAAANGLFLFFLLLGGLYVPINHLPGLLIPLTRVLPATALVDVLRATMAGTSVPLRGLVVLLVWAAGAPVLAALTFRWE